MQPPAQPHLFRKALQLSIPPHPTEVKKTTGARFEPVDPYHRGKVLRLAAEQLHGDTGDKRMNFQLWIRKPWGQIICYHAERLPRLLELAQQHQGQWLISNNRQSLAGLRQASSRRPARPPGANPALDRIGTRQSAR